MRKVYRVHRGGLANIVPFEVLKETEKTYFLRNLKSGCEGRESKSTHDYVFCDSWTEARLYLISRLKMRVEREQENLNRAHKIPEMEPQLKEIE